MNIRTALCWVIPVIFELIERQELRKKCYALYTFRVFLAFTNADS